MSTEQVAASAELIQEKLLNSPARKVTRTRLGEPVMRVLEKLDKVLTCALRASTADSRT